MSPCPVCGQSHDYENSCANVPSSSRIGQVIGGKYRVTRMIGEGGMASVYEARHTTINRPFALKFLHPWLSSDDEWLERFHREASAGGALTSEHVAAILDVGVIADGAPYILMEMLQGEDLGQCLAREVTLKPAEAIDVITQACYGLTIAHQAGVIHRDLKPENLFLCPRHEGGLLVKVLDFGIAKLRNVQLTHATRAGMVMGTPYYMSPEQARGRGGVDHRTDLYALGVMLYELLSGEKPYVGDDHGAVLNQIVGAPTPDLREVCPTLSAELSAVVQRAIAKSPNERFQTAGDFAETLRPFRSRGRGASSTAHFFGLRSVRGSQATSPHITNIEPRLTVRVTGSRGDTASAPGVASVTALPIVNRELRREAISSSSASIAAGRGSGEAQAPPKPGPNRARSSAPFVELAVASTPMAMADVPDFADLTEPDAVVGVTLTAKGQATTEALAEGSVPDGGGRAFDDAPVEDDAGLAAERTPRERQNAGTFAASDVEPATLDSNAFDGEFLDNTLPVGEPLRQPADRTPIPTSIQTVSLGKTLAPLLVGGVAIVALVVGVASAPGSEPSSRNPSAADEGRQSVESAPVNERLGQTTEARTLPVEAAAVGGAAPEAAPGAFDVATPIELGPLLEPEGAVGVAPPVGTQPSEPGRSSLPVLDSHRLEQGSAKPGVPESRAPQPLAPPLPGATPSKPANAPLSTTASPSAPAPAPSTSANVVRPDCSKRFEVGADGVRRVKLECL